jgi:hypothetical protein
VIPQATKPEVVSKIIYLLQHYHFGPHKTSMYLKRYHDVEVSPSGVCRILRRLDMSRLPASQRYRRHVDGAEAARVICSLPGRTGSTHHPRLRSHTASPPIRRRCGMDPFWANRTEQQ